MNDGLTVHELTFALVINNYDLNLSHPKFLQSSGIVAKDWSFARQPIANNQVSQATYSNNVSIIGQPHRCLIAEIFEDKSIETAESPEVVNNYLDKLSHLDYQAIGLNFRAYLRVDPQEFINKLIVPGSWQQHGTKPVQTELKFVYDLEDSRCTLTVDEGKLRQPETEALPIIVFSGNFAYQMSSEAEVNPIDRIKEVVANWHNDLDTFQEIISGFPQVKQQELVTA